MVPLLLYALIAGGMGWSISKKKWGIAAFCGSLLAWMLVIQIIQAIIAVMMVHSGSLT